ncbi:hypothetical protein VFPPC_17540 [Pochonia chlamydosporia 170]|uniref:Uncharacterized protein n=1 Tax=Pochonia chlamydosporia 170 TaxID=1380566 RepID=A0A219AR91_METCM|nr:hypothetical protein VFPPC_17540 [Pochonia chlamydosporia 170]OWT43297.1 hypothetical protein VFPPC_17540 [Pochonia chlamydosporia 170]
MRLNKSWAKPQVEFAGISQDWSLTLSIETRTSRLLGVFCTIRFNTETSQQSHIRRLL